MNFNYWTDQKKIARLNYITLKCRKPGYTTENHWHLYNEIIYLDHGEMEIEYKNTVHTINPGDCFLIPANKKHMIRNSAKVPDNFLNIGYRGTMPEEISLHPITLSEKCADIIRQLGEISHPPLDNLKAEIACCKLTEFILVLHEQLLDKSPSAKRMPVNRKHYYSEFVNRIIDIIEHRYNEPLELIDISEELGVSVSQIRALLKRETNASFIQHLQTYRMEIAKKLIQDGIDNINTIATRCGYKSQPFFFKVFRKFTGMTPLEFAKTLGSPEDITSK